MRCDKLLLWLFLIPILAFAYACGGKDDSSSDSDIEKGPPVPDHLPVDLAFTDMDPNAGIAGNVTIVKAPNERGLTDYVLYWGSDSATKLAGQPALAIIPKTGFNLTYTLPLGGAVPSGATHILLFIKNGDDEKRAAVNIFMVDRVFPAHAAGGVVFTDTDLDAGLAGVITISRASDESDLTDYVLYWGSASDTKLVGQPAIGAIPKTDPSPTYTFSGNTPVPSGASHILVFSKNDDGEMGTAANIAIKDKGKSLKMTASDAENGDNLGESVSISGNYAIVGANKDNDGGFDSGAAYIYKRDAGEIWAQTYKLTASDQTAEDNFGGSVSISGDYAIVGANNDDDGGLNSGSAYVFKRDATSETWTQQDKLTASDAAAEDYFGFSVSISGDRAVVGAYQNDATVGKFKSGSAYVFNRDATSETWTQTYKLTASDPSAAANFGYSVSISGDYIIAGEHFGGVKQGAAYVFKRDASSETWTWKGKLTASDPEANANFGVSVSIDGNYAIVGANKDDDGGSNSGSAYIFKRDVGETWTQTYKLLASDPEDHDNFGYSVSIRGDYAISGAYEAGSLDSGAAYVFKRDAGETWTEQGKLTASDAAFRDKFGVSVATSVDCAIAGSPTSTGQKPGAAYIFEYILSD